MGLFTCHPQQAQSFSSLPFHASYDMDPCVNLTLLRKVSSRDSGEETFLELSLYAETLELLIELPAAIIVLII